MVKNIVKELQWGLATIIYVVINQCLESCVLDRNVYSILE